MENKKSPTGELVNSKIMEISAKIAFLITKENISIQEMREVLRQTEDLVCSHTIANYIDIEKAVEKFVDDFINMP